MSNKATELNLYSYYKIDKILLLSSEETKNTKLDLLKNIFVHSDNKKNWLIGNSHRKWRTGMIDDFVFLCDMGYLPSEI